MEKRGQVTIFILIGIGIVFAFAIIYYLTSLQQEIPEQTAVYDQKSLENYLQSCLEKSSDEQIHSLALRGFFDGPGIQQNETIAFWCRQSDNGCKQLPVFKQDIEKVIDIKIMEKFIECADIRIFEEQGFDVVQALPEVKTKIEDQITVIELEYPLILSKGAEQLTPKKITVKNSIPLGKLIEYAIHLINLENNGFDISDFDVLVEKEKPYPHIIFSLSDNGLILKFAIEGRDTISNIGFDSFSYTSSKGCCFNTKDSLCYENVDEDACKTKGGVYNTLCNECPEPLIVNAADKSFEDCDDISHGSSWCIYEEPTGQGSDLVGSRHKMGYCYDGKIYEEYCRDYREEICVEDTSIGKALCRPNRFLSCSECTDEECCNNVELRDCYWNAYSNEEVSSNNRVNDELNKGVCVPAVPPGLKHNELLGSQICSFGNLQKSCEGSSCGQDFANYAAEICTQQGDCGMSFNVQNKQGKSFAIFDRFSPVFSKPAGINLALPMKINFYDSYKISSNLKYTQLTNIQTNFQSNLLQTWYSLLKILNKEVSTNIINNTKNQITANSLCGVWQAPEKGDCSLCNGNECSEYLCTSFGKNCIFDYNYGNPQCKEKVIENIRPQISIDIEINSVKQQIQSQDNTYKTAQFKEYTIENIGRGDDINVNIQSNELTRCSLSLSPDVENIPLASSLTFSNNHSLAVRVPTVPLITQKLIALLDLSEDIQVKQLLENPRKFLSDYIDRNNGLFREFNKFHATRLEETMAFYAGKIASALKRINKEDLPLIEYALNQNKEDFVFFVNCIDAYENKQENNHIVLADIYEDETNRPHRLLGAVPENNTPSDSEYITAYFNEPVECKWDINNVDYDDMRNVMNCANSVYDYSINFGGSYSCIMPFGRLLYAKCRDNPNFVAEYIFTLRSSDELNINQNIPEFIEEKDGIFEVSIGALADNEVIFSSPSPMQEFVISLDSPELCTLKDNENNDYKLNCNIAENELYKGLFNCNILLPIPQPDEVIFAIGLINGAPDNNHGRSILITDNLINVNLDSIKQEEYEIIHNLSIFNLQLVSDIEYSCTLNSSTTIPQIENIQIPCIYNGGSVCGTSIHNNNSYLVRCRKNIPLQKTYTIKCEEGYQKETESQEASYVFSFMEPNLRILRILPEGEVRTQIVKLEVKTNIDAERCTYNDELPLIKDNNDTTRFTTNVNLNEGKNNFSIICEDSYGNTAKDVAEIYYLK